MWRRYRKAGQVEIEQGPVAGLYLKVIADLHILQLHEHFHDACFRIKLEECKLDVPGVRLQRTARDNRCRESVQIQLRSYQRCAVAEPIFLVDLDVGGIATKDGDTLVHRAVGIGAFVVIDTADLIVAFIIGPGIIGLCGGGQRDNSGTQHKTFE